MKWGFLAFLLTKFQYGQEDSREWRDSQESGHRHFLLSVVNTDMKHSKILGFGCPNVGLLLVWE